MNLVVEQGETGLYFAASPDVKGLMAIGETREEAVTNVPNALDDLLKAALAEIAVLKRERDTYRAGFIESMKICNDFAIHLHIRGGSLRPIPECVAAQELIERGLKKP